MWYEIDMLGQKRTMKKCPDGLGGAKGVMLSFIHAPHIFTGKGMQIVAGKLTGSTTGLAICQDEDETAHYLFGCDEEWNILTDSRHQSMEEAMNQAEFGYQGTKETWTTK